MGSCRLCDSGDLQLLLDIGEHPIAHHFLTDPQQEEYVHAVKVCFCNQCGLIQLVNPISPDRFYTEYVTLSSWKNQPHVPRVLELIEHTLGVAKNARITEVGSNDGSFLATLKDAGYQDILGVEPAQDAFASAQECGVETVQGYFTRTLADELVSKRGGQSDLIVSRQVLEHIDDFNSFREALEVTLRPGGFVLIEVPNFDFNLNGLDYSGIWEEHVNYLTLETISRFLAAAQIRVIHSETTLFSGEALIVLGERVDQPVEIPSQGLEALKAKVTRFKNSWPEFCRRFKQYLSEQQANGQKIAVYGAGCRACSLINFVDIGSYFSYVVDDQMEKQNKYMPGSHLAILPSDRLEKDDINLCLLAVNAENEEKVIAKHQAFIDNGGRFASIFPPSNRLVPFWGDV